MAPRSARPAARGRATTPGRSESPRPRGPSRQIACVPDTASARRSWTSARRASSAARGGVLPRGEGEHQRRAREQHRAQAEDNPNRPAQRRLDLRGQIFACTRQAVPGISRLATSASAPSKSSPSISPVAPRNAHTTGRRSSAMEIRSMRGIPTRRRAAGRGASRAPPRARRGIHRGLGRHRPALEDVLEQRSGVRAEEEQVGRVARRADGDDDVEVRMIVRVERELRGHPLRRPGGVANQVRRGRSVSDARAAEARELGAVCGEQRDAPVELQLREVGEGSRRRAPRARARCARTAPTRSRSAPMERTPRTGRSGAARPATPRRSRP